MLMRVAAVGAVTILGLGGQLLVRIALTAHQGPGVELDTYSIALGWGGAVAAAVFQVVATCLAPQAAGSPGGEVRALARRLALVLVLAMTAAAIATALVIAASGGPLLAMVVLAVLLGWGVAGGLAQYQRQLLLARDRPLAPALLAVVPAVAILGCAGLGLIEGVLGFALIGVAAWCAVAVAGSWFLARAWGPTAPPGASPGRLRPVLTMALPALGASWNSQIVQRAQDAIAGLVEVGGATIFTNAMAMARLPQSIADSMFSASAYPAALQAIAAGDAAKLRAAYRLGLRVHLAVTVPVALAVAVAGDAAATALYAHGRCSPSDAARISQVLQWAAPGMVAISLQSIHAQLLVALGRSASGLRVELALSGLSLLCALAMMPRLGLGGIIAGHSLAQILIQVPMLRILAAAGLSWRDTVAELVRALLPALPASLCALWISSLAWPSPWLRALAVGATVLAITLPFSAWVIIRRPTAASGAS